MHEPSTDVESTQVWETAQHVLAGGVSASMRFHPYLRRPFYLTRGDGAYVYDLSGNRYLDFNCSNGASLLGHNHPAVAKAVLDGLNAGIIAAAETPFHEELASALIDIIPSAERVRFASTGSEVTLVAIRLARHATGRTKFIKFEGHFHGLTEPFLFQPADSEAHSTLVPSSGGVPLSYANDVIVLPWNDFGLFDQTINDHGQEIAAVICEPVHYNAGCIPPDPGFLELLRRRTTQEGIVLIFDEVLSGFRMALGGAQSYYNVTPDLATFAKALANGMPLSALVGRADLMEQLSPSGPVAHSGTYSGHLLSVLAALSTLEILGEQGKFDLMMRTSSDFYRELQGIFDRHHLPAVVQGLGARFGIYFGRREPVTSISDAAGHDHQLNRLFVVGCLERGVYFHAYHDSGAPGHSGFSLAHTPEDFAFSLSVMDTVAANIAKERGS